MNGSEARKDGTGKAISNKVARSTFVTERQAAVHALFVRHQSMSTVARIMGVSQITIRESLVQYQRNKWRDQGIKPPSLKAMLKGRVASRFGIERRELGGRPAIHGQIDPTAPAHVPRITRAAEGEMRVIAAPATGVTRMIVTCAEARSAVHGEFLRNLRAYAAWIGAELAIYKVGGGNVGKDLDAHLRSRPIDFDGQIEVASDIQIPARTNRPLSNVQGRKAAVWTVFAHPIVQLETLPRIRADGLQVQLTTGAVTFPSNEADYGSREGVGAVIIEISADGVGHCRHLLADFNGDGSFQDLTVRVEDGRIKQGCGIEAIVYGDVHHAHMDPDVAAATWGLGSEVGSGKSLVDRLRPRRQVFHDVCDFSARSQFDARNHHRRFAQFANGGGDVREELACTARFLVETGRPWCTSLVVASNHDEMFGHWLVETDFRDDPANALFFLRSSLALHERLADGTGTEGFFEETLRGLDPRGLSSVRFLRDGDSCKIAGVEVGIHGHKGPDGRKGGMAAFERLGIRATIGHTHRPTTRGAVWGAGVCQTELAYARGPLTTWAVGHVAIYASGARQHLFFHGGRFHAG